VTSPPASARRIAVLLTGSYTVDTRQEPERLDLEVVLGAKLAQQIDVAVTMSTEVEVFSDNDHFRRETLDEHTLHE